MWFWRRKRDAKDAEVEAEIGDLHKATNRKIDEASERLRAVSDLLEKDPTYRFWYATGGERRRKNVRR